MLLRSWDKDPRTHLTGTTFKANVIQHWDIHKTQLSARAEPEALNPRSLVCTPHTEKEGHFSWMITFLSLLHPSLEDASEHHECPGLQLLEISTGRLSRSLDKV